MYVWYVLLLPVYSYYAVYILLLNCYVGDKFISIIMEKVNTVLHQQQLMLQEMSKMRVKNTPQHIADWSSAATADGASAAGSR